MFQPAELAICLIVPAAIAASAASAMRASVRQVWFEPSLAVGYVGGHFLLTAYGEWSTRIALGQTASGTWRPAIHSATQLLLFPHMARDWIPLALLIGGVMTIAVPRQAMPPWRHVYQLAWLTLFVLFVTRLLWGSVYIEQEWTRWGTTWRLFGLGVALWLPGQVSAFGEASDSRITTLGLVSLTFTAATIAITLLLSGSKVYGLHGFAAASAVGGVSIVEMWARDSCDAPPRITPMLLGGLIILGLYFAELMAADAMLLFDAVLLSTIQLQMPELFRTRRQKTLCSVLAIILAASAVFFSAARFYRDSKPGAPNPYDQYSQAPAFSAASPQLLASRILDRSSASAYDGN